MERTSTEVRETLRILHVGPALAGFPAALAAGQRAIGHEAVTLTRPPNPYKFPSDVTLSPFKPKATWQALRFARRWEPNVVHVHGGLWWLDGLYGIVDDAILAVHYHGTETRSRNGLKWRSLPDVTFYTPPDIRDAHPGATWLPQPIDTEAMNLVSARRIEGHDPIFAHFPSDPATKGTHDIIDMFVRAFGKKAVDAGRNDIIVHGNGATLWVFYGIPHQAVLDTIANVADVVIDQYTSLGIYGYVGTEAMALGKPALSTLRRDLYPYDCPVIYPRVTKLMELARDEGYRKWLGERGRAYAGRVYDARQVATKSIDAYEANL